MKAGADFQQRPDASMNLGDSPRRFRDARKNLEQGTLPCSVATDDPDDFAAFYFEGNVIKGPNMRISNFGLRIANLNFGVRPADRGLRMTVAATDGGAQPPKRCCCGIGENI